MTTVADAVLSAAARWRTEHDRRCDSTVCHPDCPQRQARAINDTRRANER